MTNQRIPAVQYLRMSTEHQQYSLENQADAIKQYSESNGFEIVHTYSDAAKSGLILRTRKGLRQLLEDVVSGKLNCKAILVYDVSRWGRFQDADESAHYEFLCKSAGVPVHYCAEMFANDSSISGMILKALKRSMAGEYSRELSVKVKTGLTRLAKLGYKLGGSAPYGLRRQLLDTQGRPKQILKFGERKSLANEHVRFIPGPKEEIATVNRIFREFADEHRNPNVIAARLNQEGVPYLRGRTWKSNTLRLLLEDVRYIGMQVWGRTTALLSTAAKRLPVQQWQIRANAFPPIISEALFMRAQEEFANLTCRLTDDQMLGRLKLVLRAEGRLTGAVIDNSRLCPGLTTYRKRFGGALSLYARLGYDTPERLGEATTRTRGMFLRDSVIRKIVEGFPGQVEEVLRSKRYKPLLRYRKTGLLISVVVARQYPTKTGASWHIEAPKLDRKRTTVVAFLDANNLTIESLRVVPRLRQKQTKVRVGTENESMKAGMALEKIDDLFKVVKQLKESTARGGMG